jgi:hypothetical protein
MPFQRKLLVSEAIFKVTIVDSLHYNSSISHLLSTVITYLIQLQLPFIS